MGKECTYSQMVEDSTVNERMTDYHSSRLDCKQRRRTLVKNPRVGVRWGLAGENLMGVGCLFNGIRW